MEGDAGYERFAGVVGHRVGHRRLDETGGDRVHGDIARSDFERERFREADQRGFRRGVIDLAWIAGEADDRGDVDHAAPARADHLL